MLQRDLVAELGSGSEAAAGGAMPAGDKGKCLPEEILQKELLWGTYLV